MVNCNYMTIRSCHLSIEVNQRLRVKPRTNNWVLGREDQISDYRCFWIIQDHISFYWISISREYYLILILPGWDVSKHKKIISLRMTYNLYILK